MELRKIGEGVWVGLWCSGAGVGVCLQRCARKPSAMVTSSGLGPRGSHTDLLSQPIITHIERPPLRGLRAVMTMDLS